MSDWKPIDTAPKDGSCVLIYRTYDEGVDIVVAHYVAGNSSVREPHWLVNQWNDYEFADYALARNDPYEWVATHWMPLPSPPETQK